MEEQTHSLAVLSSDQQGTLDTSYPFCVSPALTQGYYLLQSVNQPPGALNPPYKVPPLLLFRKGTHSCHCQNFPLLEGRGMDKLF